MNTLSLNEEGTLETMGLLRCARNDGFCDSVGNVIFIASSSRGGSSVFAEILRDCDAFLHFRAEINPFLHVNGLAYPDTPSGSDALSALDLTENIRLALNRDLGAECGSPKLDLLSSVEIDAYASAVAGRLSVQWPGQTFSYETTRRWILSTFEILQKSFGWTQTEVRNGQLFWCVFLSQLRSEFPDISPYYYDLNPDLVATHFPGLCVPEGPPTSHLIEEPPFIVPVPLKQPTQREVAQKPLVIKTPSNAYRFDFLKALFPNATPWILHLTRNAAPSINGLYDGWCHRGFFAHYMPGRLNIAGYSDRFPKWGKDWWNFDLPPGWQDYVSKSLVEVCAFQWQSAHRATLEYMRKVPKTNYLRLKSEDILSQNDEIRGEAAEKICRWLGWNANDSLSNALRREREPVMATQTARPDRWRDRENIIGPVVAQGKIKEMLHELGYPPAPSLRGV